MPETELEGLPQARVSAVIETELECLPQARVPAVIETELEGLPQARVSAVIETNTRFPQVLISINSTQIFRAPSSACDTKDLADSTRYLIFFCFAKHTCGAQRRRFFGAALFHWPVLLACFLKKLNAEDRPMFLFRTPFPQFLSFSSRGADFFKKCVLSCGSLLYHHTLLRWRLRCNLIQNNYMVTMRPPAPLHRILPYHTRRPRMPNKDTAQLHV